MRAALMTIGLTSLLSSVSFSQVNVLTANYENGRSNANLQETTLTPSHVSTGNFGRIGAFPADGQVYAQPLYLSGLAIPGKGTRNVLYVMTQHNGVFAYDADTATSPVLLWNVSLGAPVPSAMFGSDYADIAPEVGILSTGTIDTTRGVLYVVSANPQGSTIAYQLHALSLTTGAETLNGPVVISASVTGNGAGSNNGTLTFDPMWHIQRPGLLLANNAVYVSFGSHGDAGSWHGWMMSYNASNLSQQLGVLNSTPNGLGGSIWQSGHGLASDSAGDIYVITGNGDFDGQTNYSESFLKLTGAAPAVADWFTPNNWQTLADNDYDVSAGPVLIPGTQSIVAGDKSGQLYLINGASMGHLGGNNVQTIQGVLWGSIFNFALWNRSDGAFVYVQEQGSVVKGYQIANGALNPTPALVSTVMEGAPRVGMAISANGGQIGTGILWETTASNTNPAFGELHAFDASTLAELWNSDMTQGPDVLGAFAKFATPTVVNGKVYVPTLSDQVAVYGLLGPGAGNISTPTISAVTNAASYAQTVSPGEMVTIFGSNLGPATPAGTLVDVSGKVATLLSNTVVLFDGIPAPAIYVSPTQVSAVAPFSLQPLATSQVQVVYQGQASAQFLVNMTAAAPGIFSVGATGSGEALVVNNDGTVNSSAAPAPSGSIVTLYLTGAGILAPALPDGSIVAVGNLPQVTYPVAVQVGGQAAQVLYSGGAPGMVAGIIQLNIQLPGGIAGATVPIVVQIGGNPSQAGLTLAIQ